MNDPSKFWQISVNGATPQTFAQKFFHNVRRELRHTDLDRLTFVAGGRAIDATPLMNYGDAVAVTRNGKPFFAGTALPPRLVGRPNEENHLYTVVSPWYDLTRTFYQQEWTVWDGTYVNEGGLLVPHTVTEYLSTLVLFMQQNGSLLTAQAQIQDAINFAIGHGMSAEIQLGTVDMNFQPPIDIIKGAITCAEIIQKAIRWAKDAVAYFDYTTSPPTLNVRQRANLPAVTKPLASSFNDSNGFPGFNAAPGGYVKDVSLTQRTDLVPKAVVVQYIEPSTENGFTSYARLIDWAVLTSGVGVSPATFAQGGSMPGPPSGYDTAPADEPTGVAVVPVPIQLVGFKINYIEQQVTTVSIDTSSQSWWTSHCAAEFNRTGLTVLDGPYNNTAPTYPNEIVRGSFAAWMGAQNKHAMQETVYADIDIQFTDPNTGSVIKETRHLSANITSSDIATGGVTFQNVTSFSLGEPLPPIGLPLAYLQSLTPAQWEGTCTIVEQECSGSVTPGKVLNISGAGVPPAWSSMNAMVAAVDEDWDTGETHITLGIPKHLSVADMIELANVSRWRNEGAPGNFFIRAGGYTADGNAGLLPDTPPAASLSGAAASGAPDKLVLADSEEPGQSVTIDPSTPHVQVVDSDGNTITLDASVPKVAIAYAGAGTIDCDASELPSGTMNVQQVTILVPDPSVSPNPDANGCWHVVSKTGYFLCTTPS